MVLGTHRRGVPALGTTAAQIWPARASVDLGARGVGSWNARRARAAQGRGEANGGGGAKNGWLTAALGSGGARRRQWRGRGVRRGRKGGEEGRSRALSSGERARESEAKPGARRCGARARRGRASTVGETARGGERARGGRGSAKTTNGWPTRGALRLFPDF